MNFGVFLANKKAGIGFDILRVRRVCYSPEVHQERVLQVLHDLKLFEDIAYFIPFHALELVHVLHGIHLLSVLLLHDTHLEKNPQKNN